MNTITFRGPAGELRWGYYTAAILGAWEVSGTTLTAQVVSCNPSQVSQRPVMFVVPRGASPAWRWPIETLQIAGTSLTATVLPPE